MGEGPIGIILDIAGEMERAAGLYDAGEFFQRRWRNEAALVVARFRPGIGIEQINRIDTGIGQGDEKFQRIIGEKPDIGKVAGNDGLHHLADAAGKHFAADKAGVRFFLCLARQMFAAAIADFDDALGPAGEQRCRLDLDSPLKLTIDRLPIAIPAPATVADQKTRDLIKREIAEQLILYSD